MQESIIGICRPTLIPQFLLVEAWKTTGGYISWIEHQIFFSLAKQKITSADFCLFLWS